MRKISTLLIIVLFLGFTAGTALADDTITGLSLTLQQAVDMALKNSKAVKSAELSVESTRNTADQNSKYYGGAIPAGSTPDQYMNGFLSLVNSNINWDMAKKTLTMKQDTAVYTVLKDYTAVLGAIDSLNAAQLAANNAQLKRSIAQISNRVGVASDYDWETAQQAYTTVQANLTTAQVNLDKAYQALNRDLGLEADARPFLTEKPQYSKFEVADVDADIYSTVQSTPSVWNADKGVETAQISQSLYNWNAGQRTTPYENTDINISQAKITAFNTRQGIETLLRNTYNGIISGEKTIESQEKLLHVAKQNLRIGRIKYDIGMITRADLNDLEAALATAAANLNASIYSHELSKMVFKKPWVAAS